MFALVNLKRMAYLFQAIHQLMAGSVFSNRPMNLHINISLLKKINGITTIFRTNIKLHNIFPLRTARKVPLYYILKIIWNNKKFSM